MRNHHASREFPGQIEVWFLHENARQPGLPLGEDGGKHTKGRQSPWAQLVRVAGEKQGCAATCDPWSHGPAEKMVAVLTLGVFTKSWQYACPEPQEPWSSRGKRYANKGLNPTWEEQSHGDPEKGPPSRQVGDI